MTSALVRLLAVGMHVSLDMKLYKHDDSNESDTDVVGKQGFEHDHGW